MTRRWLVNLSGRGMMRPTCPGSVAAGSVTSCLPGFARCIAKASRGLRRCRWRGDRCRNANPGPSHYSVCGWLNEKMDQLSRGGSRGESCGSCSVDCASWLPWFPRQWLSRQGRSESGSFRELKIECKETLLRGSREILSIFLSFRRRAATTTARWAVVAGRMRARCAWLWGKDAAPDLTLARKGERCAHTCTWIPRKALSNHLKIKTPIAPLDFDLTAPRFCLYLFLSLPPWLQKMYSWREILLLIPALSKHGWMLWGKAALQTVKLLFILSCVIILNIKLLFGEGNV